jgi:hypothetical protein
MTLAEYRKNNPHLTRPVCRACDKPLILVPDFDEPGDRWSLECRSGWSQSMWQTDEVFWGMWNNLPGDEVVRLEKELGVA